MRIADYIENVRKFFYDTLGQKCRVLTIIKEEGKWKVVCEVIMDTNYTTRKGIGDIVEIYEVYLDDDQEILGYKLIATKNRAEVDD